MSLERYLREQVYYYKRRQHLKGNKKNSTGPRPAYSKPKIVGFQVNTPSSSRPLVYRPSPRRRRQSNHFYGGGIGARQIAGLVCFLLAIMLILTQCFGPGDTKATMSTPKASKQEETTSKISKDSVATSVKVNNETPLLVADTSEQESSVDSSEAGYYDVLQDFAIDQSTFKKLKDFSLRTQREFANTLSLWALEKFKGTQDGAIYKKVKSSRNANQAEHPDLYRAGATIYKQFIYDIKFFPIPKNRDYTYENTWKQQRTFNGDRPHYGIDIMDTKNSSGKIPIVSMTDGTIENIGWNEAGGYRVGVRSPSGAYFYYAHLHELPTHIKKGDKIQAGDYIGLMGSTGYGPEGTKDQFPVHLHVGIATIKSEEETEFWINPYPILQYIEDRKTTVY